MSSEDTCKACGQELSAPAELRQFEIPVRVEIVTTALVEATDCESAISALNKFDATFELSMGEIVNYRPTGKPSDVGPA